MKIGAKGPDVVELQNLLNKNGFSLNPDGQFGPATDKAVRKFQEDAGLKIDGDVGPLTLSKLRVMADLTEDEPILDKKLDARTTKCLNSLDPKAQVAFIPFIMEAKEIAARSGYEYCAVSGNRTWAEQDALYAQGRTKPGNKVTNAKGGQSNHNFKIALDFGVFKDGKYLDDSQPTTADNIHKVIGKIATKYGLEWGGSWTSIKDYPHFEIKTGLTMSQKRERFSKFGSVM